MADAANLLQGLEFVETNKKPGVPPCCKLKDRTQAEQALKLLGLSPIEGFKEIIEGP